MSRIQSASRRAFTLVELLAVVLILGVLLAILIPTFLNSRDDAHDASAATELITAYHRAKVYWVDKEQFPVQADLVSRLTTDEPAISFSSMDGLDTGSADQGQSVRAYSDGAQTVAFTRLSESGNVMYLYESGGIASANFPVPGVVEVPAGGGGGGGGGPTFAVGTIDASFASNASAAANGGLFSAAIQSDGKILLGGFVSTWSGTTVNKIVRLNIDGTRDADFTTNAGTAANGNVLAIATQADNAIVLGGAFTTWNGSTVNRLVRLNADGTRDASFSSNIGSGAPDIVRSVAVQPDGKVLVGGDFWTFNGLGGRGIVRLNADGTRDTGFRTNMGSGASGVVYEIAVQPDGKIILGGDFDQWNGATVNKIVRLNADGTRDTDFTANAGSAIGTPWSNSVRAIAIQSDGKIIVAGAFTTWNGVSANRIVRLNADGTRDTSYDAGVGTAADNSIMDISIQSDGRAVIGGNFTTWNGVPAGRFVRLDANGALDVAFQTSIGSGANSTVYAVPVQSDGKIVAAGYFTQFSGAASMYVTRVE